MTMYRFNDPDWEDRLWFGMGYGRQIAIDPVLPDVTPVLPSSMTRGKVTRVGAGALDACSPGQLSGADQACDANFVFSGLSPSHAYYPNLGHLPNVPGLYYPRLLPGHVAGHVPWYGTGFSLDDLIPDPIKQAASSIWDGVSDVAKKFSNTGPGAIILDAIATTATGGLVPILGPQLATIAFAIPGVLRGEPVDVAWTKEWVRRITDTASILAPKIGQTVDQVVGNLGEQLNSTLTRIAANPALQELSSLATRIPSFLESLAGALNIRVDVAAAAKDIWDRNINLPHMSLPFDPLTGSIIKPASPTAPLPAPRPTLPPMPTATIPAGVVALFSHLAPSVLDPGTRFTATTNLWHRYFDAAHGNLNQAIGNMTTDYNAKKIVPVTVSADAMKLVSNRLSASDFYTAVNALWDWLMRKSATVAQVNQQLTQLVNKGPIMTVADIQAQLLTAQHVLQGQQAQLNTATIMSRNPATAAVFLGQIPGLQLAVKNTQAQITSLQTALAQAQKAPQPITDPATLQNMIVTLKKNLVLMSSGLLGQPQRLAVLGGIIQQIQGTEQALNALGVPTVVEDSNTLMQQALVTGTFPGAVAAVAAAPPTHAAALMTTATTALQAIGQAGSAGAQSVLATAQNAMNAIAKAPLSQATAIAAQVSKNLTAAVNPAVAMSLQQWIAHYQGMKALAAPGHAAHTSGISRFVAGCAC